MGAGKPSSSAGLRPNRGNLGQGSGDAASGAAKIGLIATLLAALIAGTATVLASLINNGSSRTLGLPGVPTLPQLVENTFTEQVHTSNPAGAATFRDSLAFTRKVPPGQRVEVVCRFLDPKAAHNGQSDWWYVVASSPWNGQFYTPAIFYLNGDPPEGPYSTNVDSQVRCVSDSLGERTLRAPLAQSMPRTRRT